MIELSNLTKSYGSQELFSDINLRMNFGDKIGLVGRNGSGKSTLFKLILGEEQADNGEVLIPKGYKIGALKQYLHFTEKTLVDETALALAEDDKYSIYKVERILFGLGFSHEDLEKDPLSFSGGYQIRINLAKLLLTEPNMLLLDEPTNYLDILSLRWLKGFLKAFEGEVIIITHDRDFMDAVTTHTMGIIRRGLFFIKGDTHKFYDQLASNEEHHEKQKVAQDKKIKELEDFISRNKARASTAALAQSKVKQLEKMDILEDLGYDNTLSFDFKYKATPAKILLDVKDVSFGYTQDNLLFENISFVLEKGETLGIIGKNGKGKSTLLNVIAGELKPLAGEVEYNSSVTFGHFGQTNINHLNPKSTIIDEIYSVNSKLGEATVRNICGLMMFSGDNAKKKVSLLSGGEKSRVMLGKIIAKEVNLLFLDEPTHHLDIDSIEALTHAIKDFEGSAIIVSHSEELLRATCDRLIVFSSEGANYFNGTYDEFLEKIGWEDEEFDTKPKKQKNSKNDVKRERSEVIAQKSKELTPLKKELDKLEGEIERLEGIVKKSKIEVIEASNKNDNSKVVELTKNIANLEKNIETKFAIFETKQLKYDELSEMFEKKLEVLS